MTIAVAPRSAPVRIDVRTTRVAEGRRAGCAISVVMPCLDEAATVAGCITDARRWFERAGVAGEVIVADNGSRDASAACAEAAGGRVVPVARRGYGAAIAGGVARARGDWIIVGDADGSYDFSRLDAFLARLRAGDDVVIGDRFAGGIQRGAMPFLNRWLGNPALSAIGRIVSGARVRDFHCGLRGFRRSAWDAIEPRCDGMEAASELIVRAHFAGLRISEVPTALRATVAGRRSHLRPWRDALRHLRVLIGLWWARSLRSVDPTAAGSRVDQV